MKNNTKKWLTVAGCLVLCAVLVGLIGMKLQTSSPKDEPLPSQSAQPSDVTVVAPDTEKEKEKEKDVVVIPPEVPAASQPSGSGAVSSGTEQTIQPDPVKPESPSEDALKDNTQTPDGKPVTTPPPAVDHDKVDPPKDTPKPDNQPQGGDTKDGKIYVPGFGWIEDEGGGGQGTVGESDGDINKQVGTMD